MFMPRHALGVALLSLFLAGCAQCPPVWASTLSDDETGWLAAGVAGTTFIDANAERLALTRAVRVLADRLDTTPSGSTVTLPFLSLKLSANQSSPAPLAIEIKVSSGSTRRTQMGKWWQYWS